MIESMLVGVRATALQGLNPPHFWCNVESFSWAAPMLEHQNCVGLMSKETRLDRALCPFGLVLWLSLVPCHRFIGRPSVSWIRGRWADDRELANHGFYISYPPAQPTSLLMPLLINKTSLRRRRQRTRPRGPKPSLTRLW
jgi:hypothetical protein